MFEADKIHGCNKKTCEHLSKCTDKARTQKRMKRLKKTINPLKWVVKMSTQATGLSRLGAQYIPHISTLEAKIDVQNHEEGMLVA